MAELELETIDRAVRWCAEAGRQTTAGEVRAALGALGWDQLLAVRALLADPPPTRPLGPHALADLARGVPPDVASEREREERYPPPGERPPDRAAPSATPHPAPAKRTRASQASRRAQVVVRKAPSATPAPAAAPARLPLFEELLLPAGRGELGRLIRVHGGRRPRLVAALAAAHRRADGAPVGDAELDAALDHHGLSRGFARRERAELIHAVRAAGAVLARAAAALGHDLPGLRAATTRLALDAEVKRLRQARQRELRARATLSERAALVVGSADTLADLDLLEEFERDLKDRLPGHLRALATTGEPLELGLARSLSLPAASVKALLGQLGVELRAPDASGPPPTRTPAPAGSRSPARPRTSSAGMRSLGRPATGGRPTGGRPTGGRPTGGRPAGGRPAGDRPAGGRAGGPRPSGGRPASGRPAPWGRPAAAGRPSGSRPFSSRPSGTRPSGGRPGGGRPSGGRPASGRPAGPRRPAPGGGRRGPGR